MNFKQLDSYSILIVSKYFYYEQDYINIICVCKKFQETTEKLRFNPIPIKSLKLFPKIQTQYLYNETDVQLCVSQIVRYDVWYRIYYDEYVKNKTENTNYHYVVYTHKNRIENEDSIPDGVTILGFRCFGNSSLWVNDLIVYEHAENEGNELGINSNRSASNIKEIVIPSTIKFLDNGCFYLCTSLISITLPNTIAELSDKCFSNCSALTSINLPPSLTSIGDWCFFCCSSLKSIDLPSSLKSLSLDCFCYCKSLTLIDLPSTLTSLGDSCFSNCSSLKSIEIPSSLKSLNNFCFYNCTSLTSINLPSTLTSLGDYCFCGCLNLELITEVNKLKIGKECFKECHKLKIKTSNTNCVIC